MIDRIIPSGLFKIVEMHLSPGDLKWLIDLDLISRKDLEDFVNIKSGEGGLWDDLYFEKDYNEKMFLLSKARNEPILKMSQDLRENIIPAILVLNWANTSNDDDEFFQRLADIWVRLDHPEWLQKFLPFIPPGAWNPFKGGFSSARSIAVAEAQRLARQN